MVIRARRWMWAITWPQLVALGFGLLVVMVSGIFFVDPGRVAFTVTEPGYDDATGSLTGEPTPVSIDIACPALFGALRSSSAVAVREMDQRMPSSTWARQYEDSRSEACSARARSRALAGGTGLVVGVLAAAGLLWALRRRGPRVFVEKERVAVPVDDLDPPIMVCRLCGRPRVAAKATLAAGLDGSASLCRSCLAEHQAHTGLVLLTGSLYCLVAGVTIAAAGSPDVGAAAVGIGLLVPLLFVQIVPHELAHAVVGRMTGFRVPQVTIGVGVRLLVWRIGRTVIVGRAVPASGYTALNTTSTSFYRLRLWLSIAAGPAASMLILAVAWGWQPDPDGVAAATRTAVMVTAGWVLVANLWPRDRPGVYGSMSDGWQLITIPRLSAHEIEGRVVRGQALDALALHEQVGGDLELPVAVRTRLQVAAASGDRQAAAVAATVLVAQRDWSGAAGLARNTLAAMRPSDAEFAYMANALAWSLLVAEDPISAEADEASEIAYRLDASAPIAGTRGSVLIELGQIDEGMPLVLRSLAASLDDTSRALDLCYIAIGEAGRGETIRARSTLAVAERLDPQCTLLKRARSRVASVESVNKDDDADEQHP